MNNQKAKVTMGLTIVLTTIFVVLKLTGLIDWNWFWVLSPIIIEMVLAFLILAGYITLSILIDRDKKRKSKVLRK